MTLVNELVQFDQDFDFKKEGIIEKNSYKRRVYLRLYLEN